MYPNFGVGYICRLFGKTRQGWYEQCERKEDRSLEAIIILKLVEEIRLTLPRVGVRKLLYMLQPRIEEHDIKFGRDKLYDRVRSSWFVTALSQAQALYNRFQSSLPEIS
jgi:hypothetical protein